MSDPSHRIETLERRVRELTEANERATSAMRDAHMGTWEVDLRTQHASASETMLAVFGVKEPPADGHAFFTLVHPDDRHLIDEAIARSASTNEDYRVAFRAAADDGSTRWIEAIGHVAVDAQGRPAVLRGVCVDVTERRHLEEQLRQSQKIEPIGQLAGGVAHDFNNLLTSILGNANLLESDLSPNDPNRALVAEIIRSGERAAGLTRQLLAFSRKQVIQPTLVDLNKLVDGVSQMLRRLIPEHIDLRTDPARAPVIVRADPGQLEQVLINLAVNARDAMPAGGRIVISTGTELLDRSAHFGRAEAKPGAYALIRVADSGTGMDASTKERVFEPFFTTKELGKGTGLGLATVYGIVKQNNGYILVESEVGAGSTFSIYLPHADGEPAARTASARSAAHVEPASATVLLVEDEVAVRSLAERILTKAGYRVIGGRNASEAIRALENARAGIDLLITDVVMPGTSGPTLAEEVLARRPDVPILFMSGYTDADMGAQARAGGRAAFLEKPFTASDLLGKVRSALRGDR